MREVTGFLTSQLHQQFACRHILKAHLQPNKKTGPRIVEARIGDSLDERQIVHRAASGALDKTWKCEWACRLPSGQWAYLNDVTSTVHGSVLQKATMRVSSAFAPGDGIVIWSEGVSIWKETASKNACTEAFAYLMVEDAARHPEESRVLLHQIHWKMPLADLLAQVRSLHSLATTGPSSAGQPVAPVPVSASGDDDKGEAAQTVTPFISEPRGKFQTLKKGRPSAMSECPEASAMRLEVLEVLINMSAQSKEEDGSVQPSHAPIIVHSGQRVRPAEVLGRLLQPGELILFLKNTPTENSNGRPPTTTSKKHFF